MRQCSTAYAIDRGRHDVLQRDLVAPPGDPGFEERHTALKFSTENSVMTAQITRVRKDERNDTSYERVGDQIDFCPAVSSIRANSGAGD
jgi:hypothetical protein